MRDNKGDRLYIDNKWYIDNDRSMIERQIMYREMIDR